MSSFHVDARINVKLEVELAFRLGELLLASGSQDKQILALGHVLTNIDKDEPESKTWKKESSIVSDWEDNQNYTPAVSTMKQKVARKFMKHHDEKWGME